MKEEIQVAGAVEDLKIRPYEHHAKYYETDQMGIIHHSNYVKWMEEARMDLMDQIGLNYKEMEQMEIISPVLSTPCQRLRAYGKPHEILAEAEEELATLPQLATEDMFITEHYFIETSNYGVAILPIQEIIWIYKYSTLHKFLWHHFSISYTLHITANKRQYIHCPKNIKSDIDGIMDYLAEANHNILVGFSEENRLRVEEIQGDLKPFQKLWAFLGKKV